MYRKNISQKNKNYAILPETTKIIGKLYEHELKFLNNFVKYVIRKSRIGTVPSSTLWRCRAGGERTKPELLYEGDPSM